MENQKIDLDALEAAHKKGVEVSGYVDGPDYERIHSVWDALPALIAELREQRRERREREEYLEDEENTYGTED